MVVVALGVGLLHVVTGPDYRGPLATFVNGYLIDILLPFAVYLLLTLPDRPFKLSRPARAVVVVGLGITVEVLQFHGVPIFGSTFDPLDFWMYAVGVVLAVGFERAVLARLSEGEGAHSSA